jgi:hypothetical protein
MAAFVNSAKPVAGSHGFSQGSGRIQKTVDSQNVIPYNLARITVTRQIPSISDM